VNLVRGNRRPPEQSQSYMCESALLRRARRPILSLHYTVVRRWTAERDAVALVVSPHTSERAAASDASLEMVNVRWFQIQTRRLVVAAVLVEPRNRVRICPAVRRHLFVAVSAGGSPGAHGQRGGRSRAGAQKISSITDRARI
jgi:hypothetical protein